MSSSLGSKHLQLYERETLSQRLQQSLRVLKKGNMNSCAKRSAWIQDTQIITQGSIIVQQVRRRRYVIHLLARQIDRQQVRTLELDKTTRCHRAAQIVSSASPYTHAPVFWQTASFEAVDLTCRTRYQQSCTHSAATSTQSYRRCER